MSVPFDGMDGVFTKRVERNTTIPTDADTSALRSAIDRVNEAKKGEDAAVTPGAVDAPRRASQAMAEHLDAASASASASAAGGTTSNGPASTDGGPRDGTADDWNGHEFTFTPAHARPPRLDRPGVADK